MSLTIIDSPYRDLTQSVLEYVADLHDQYPRGRWWEHLLHNQSALRLKARLLFQRGVMVTNVPWQLASSHNDVKADDTGETRQPAETVAP